MTSDHNSKYVTNSDFISKYSDYQGRCRTQARHSDVVSIGIVTELLRGGASRRILDVACSTGNHLYYLRAALPEARLVGADLAVESIQRCRADAALSSIEFHVADLLKLESLGTFDVITANAVTFLLDWDDFHGTISSLPRTIELA